MLKDGDKAPGFSVTGDDGEKVSLADYRGKNVVLYLLSQGEYSRLNERSVRVS